MEWFQLSPEEVELFAAIAETVPSGAREARRLRPTRESGIPDLASEWPTLMGELKRRSQALTAAVYSEAQVESVDGDVLRLVYPESQAFHVQMARDPGHLEKLVSVLRERTGRQVFVQVNKQRVSSRDIIRDREGVFRAVHDLFDDGGSSA
jgi:hypothetical protein